MALNFGLLDQGGPTNFFEGYSQGQEKMQANAMAQQRAAQAQQEFGMRQQEFAAGQAEKKRLSTAAIVTQRTASAREAILNARTPDDARAIEKAQHADEYLGPIRRQFGSLEADLADIPNEPTAFNQWKLKQALGAAKFIERMDADAQFAAAMGGAPARAAPTPTPTAQVAAVAPTVQASIDDMVSRGIPREAITTGPEGQVYVGSYGSNVVGEPTMEQYRTPEGSLATRPQAPLTPLRVAANQMAPGSVNAMAPQAPATAAPPSELQRLIDRRDNLSRISDQTPKIKTNIENLNKDIERLSRSKAEIVKVIGVAAGTKNPVYLDVNTDEQYTYITGTDGKQTRKLYSGPVDRSTSNVSQNVSNKVDAFIPASETVQAELMKELRVTFNALKNAQPTLDNIEAAKALVPTAKGFMGVGGEPLLAAASFLNNRLGTKIDTQGVTDANVLRSRLFFGILDNLKKLDSQPSQSQQAAMQEALGSLGTDPNALGRVLDAFGDSIRTKVDSFNTEVSDAETRGIKFPYSATIKIKPKIGGVTGATTAHPPDIQAIINAQKGK